MSKSRDVLVFVVLGASGDLAQRKVLPALFALDARGLLPIGTRLYGYARTEMTDKEFRKRLSPRLHCEDLSPDVCALGAEEFLKRCHYQSGEYGDPGDLSKLHERIARECGHKVNRVYFLAIPPHLFGPAAAGLQASVDAAKTDKDEGWTRVVIEKPFGRDRRSSDELTSKVRQAFAEEQIFRIDHYLGKEVIQNLMVLRFANRIFEPLWNRDHVRHVHISWSENLSLRGRAGYFDHYGILRDVMQNHLTQMLALTAMECPWDMSEHCVRNEKVNLLRHVTPLTRDRVVLGQYGAGTMEGEPQLGYMQEPGVPGDSCTPTYAAAVFEIRSSRWRGVPFMISAGKGLNCHRTEIRVQFKDPEFDLFENVLAQGNPSGRPSRGNELMIRVQPNERINLRIVSKIPGIGMRLDNPMLDLSYRETYQGLRISDAYEALLLDVLRGDRSLFIRDDELEASWDIFTPLLHELDATQDRPEPYPFGSRGPEQRIALARKFNIEDPD